MTASTRKPKAKSKKTKADPTPTEPRVLVALTTRDKMRLRMRSLVDERTIRKWARGDPKIRTVTAMRLERACAELGIELRA